MHCMVFMFHSIWENTFPFPSGLKKHQSIQISYGSFNEKVCRERRTHEPDSTNLTPRNACRHIDENPNSTIVAETMKLLANSLYFYHVLARSGHTVAKYLNEEKILAPTTNCLRDKFLSMINSIRWNWWSNRLNKRSQSLWVFLTLNYANFETPEL